LLFSGEYAGAVNVKVDFSFKRPVPGKIETDITSLLAADAMPSQFTASKISPRKFIKCSTHQLSGILCHLEAQRIAHDVGADPLLFCKCIGFFPDKVMKVIIIHHPM